MVNFETPVREKPDNELLMEVIDPLVIIRHSLALSISAPLPGLR